MRQSKSVRALYGVAMLVFLLVLLPLPVLALENLYTVAVPFDPENPDALNNAYKEALDRVLVRVTGSDDEDHLLQLADIFVNPTRYVLRFRPGPDNTLLVSFDGKAIEKLLRQFHHTIWGEDRPVTLVWLAVDWGKGEREIVGADDERQFADATRSIDRNRLLRERVAETAKRRGISVIFPLLDTEDRRSIGFSDIWGGFDDRLVDASRRYGASSILVGRVRVDSVQASRWTYYFGEERLSWSGEPEAAVGQVADALAAQFAIRGDAVLQFYALTVSGVDSITAYGRITQLMENLGTVEEFSLKTVLGNKVEYSVSIYGDIERLSKALEFSGVLQPTQVIDAGEFREGPMTDPNRLYFTLVPPPELAENQSGVADVSQGSFGGQADTRASE